MTQPPQWGQQPPGGYPPPGQPPGQPQGYPQGQPQWGPPQQGQPQQGQPQWGQPQQGQPQQGQPGAPVPGYGPPPVPYGPPPGQQPGPPQGSPPKKGGVASSVLGCVGVLAVGIVLVIVVAVLNTVDGGGGAKAGDCVNVTNPSSSDPEWKKVGCGTAESDYRVAQYFDGNGTCGSDYAALEKPGDYALCLAPDVKVGDCLTDDGNIVGGDIQVKVPCGDPTAKQQITTVVHDGSGDRACTEEAENYFVISDEPLTVCYKNAH